jgi:hypothetical protein
VTASIKGALTEAFDGLGGVPALVQWGKTNPTPFYLCWSRLAPKEPPETNILHIGQLHLDALRAPRIAAFVRMNSEPLASQRLPAGSDDASARE